MFKVKALRVKVISRSFCTAHMLHRGVAASAASRRPLRGAVSVDHYKMASLPESRVESDHGYQVFKKNFVTLVEEIQPEPDLCDGLLSASIINEEEYQFATDEKKKEKHRTRKLLFKTLQSIRSKYQHFEAFCALLHKSELAVHRK